VISLRATQLLLRYFDSIDEIVSIKLMRKRPWLEEALTLLFCDLLDEEAQEEDNTKYPLSSLRNDLAKINEPLYIDTRIETHQYPKSVEHFVTQSDLGLIIQCQNQFESRFSFSRSWLFQAKRLFPHGGGAQKKYTEKSSFTSSNSDQNSRMERIRQWAKYDFIRYLLYCPSSSSLDKNTCELLSYQRTLALTGEIFDFALGLQLRDDLLSNKSTLDAGIFISPMDKFPSCFKEVHRRLFQGSTPFSWFIIQHFFQQNGKNWDFDFGDAGENSKIVESLVRGDHRVLQNSTISDLLEGRNSFRLLPAHTINIRFICGLDRPGTG